MKLSPKENVILTKEELDYKFIDTRINTIAVPMNGGIKFMIEVPVPIVNWELDLSLYEKGVLFFTKMNDIGSVLIKIIKFIIIIWTPLNYIKQFINERRKI
jgi:hypothetical protein